MVRIDYTDYRQPEQYGWVPGSSDSLTGAEDVVKKAKSLYESLQSERARLESIDKWYRGVQEIPQVRQAEPEMDKLLELARTPWLSLAVSTIAQALFVDGFKSPNGDTVQSAWLTWLANGMPSRQAALYRAALGYGYSYLHVRAGMRNGKPMSVMQGISPKRGFAVYRDPAFDEWPVYAIKVIPLNDGGDAIITLLDDVFEHELKVSKGKWTILSSKPHGAGCVPFVRYAPMLDLDGSTPGEVEPLIGVASRIDKTMFDRMLTQHYNSWKKIWIAGLQKAEGMSKEDQARIRTILRQQDMMILADKDTKVGTLEETSLEGFIAAVQDDVDELTALAQVPAYLFNGGKLSNLGADTIVAANKPFTQKVFERQVSFEQSHNQALRLAAFLQGDLQVAEDLESHVTWQDIEIRSFSQAADALGKFVETLGVPKSAMWRKIPGVTETEAREWENLALSDDPIERMLFERELAENAPAPTVDEGNDDGSADAATDAPAAE